MRGLDNAAPFDDELARVKVVYNAAWSKTGASCP